MANLNEKEIIITKVKKKLQQNIQDKFVCVNLLLRKESNKDEFETPK